MGCQKLHSFKLCWLFVYTSLIPFFISSKTDLIRNHTYHVNLNMNSPLDTWSRRPRAPKVVSIASTSAPTRRWASSIPKQKLSNMGSPVRKNEAAQQLQLEMPRVPHGPLAAAAAMMVVSAARCRAVCGGSCWDMSVGSQTWWIGFPISS